MTYKGKYIPKNPQKYKGNPSQIIYRSLWERKFMVYCDKNPKVIEWGSEEVIVPYRSPWDGKIHRYFPDFYIKIEQTSGGVKSLLSRSNQNTSVKNLPKHQRNAHANGIVRLKHMVSIKPNGNLR